jgi:predicted GNAT family acetyltransferase
MKKQMAKSNPDTIKLSSLEFEPVTKNNWDKLEQLFGINGACGNCWCMYFRLNKHDFDEGKRNDGNKNALKKLVWENSPVGLLAIFEGQPIAWCALAPREDFSKLERSRIHKRIDDKEVWSVPCTFIDKKFRRRGVSVELLKGVVKYAGTKGIKIIEAYPAITGTKLPDAFAWIGLYKSFERAGFEIVDRKSKNRPMVRYYLD